VLEEDEEGAAMLGKTVQILEYLAKLREMQGEFKEHIERQRKF